MSGWRHTTDTPPVHVWPDWERDRPHDITRGAFCWCDPKAQVIVKDGQTRGLMYTHRPTFRQRLHYWPTAMRSRVRKARQRVRAGR